MQSFNRAFLHVDFQPAGGIKWNGTLQFHGRKRIYGSAAYSPDFITLNSQVSKKWKNGLEAALSIENLTGFRQKELIQFRELTKPASFDAARIWGPSIGQMVYLNLRYSY